MHSCERLPCRINFCHTINRLLFCGLYIEIVVFNHHVMFVELTKTYCLIIGQDSNDHMSVAGSAIRRQPNDYEHERHRTTHKKHKREVS